MGGESPVVELYDSNGNPLSVQNGVAIPANTPALLFAGSDGTNSRYITIDGSGHPVVVGAGTAGSPSGGVISIQGVASGTVVPVSGSLTGFTSVIDSNNSTTATLGSNATFTGTGTDVSNYASISVQIFTDQNSATDGLQLQWSQNNSNWDEILKFTITASAAESYVVGPHARYFRIVYNNGTSVQGTMRLQVILHPVLIRHDTIRISDAPDGQQDASMVKAIISGKTTGGGGGYVDVKVNPSGTLTVDASNSTNVGITGTVTANIGTTNGLALDTTLSKLTISQGTALGSNTQALVGGSVTTASPTYTTGNINPLSLTTAGALRIDGSGVTQPISGTVTANAGTGTFTISGTVTANAGTGNFNNSAIGTVGSAAPSSASLAGYSDGTNTQLARVFDVDTGAGAQYVQGVNLRLSANGGSVEFGTNSNPIRIDPTGTTIQPVSGTITANAGSGNFAVVQSTASNLLASVGGLGASGAVTVGNPVRIGGSDGTNTRDIATDSTGKLIVIGTATDNTTNSTAKLPILGAVANTSAPSWTNGNMVPLSVDTSGNLRITGSISATNPSVSTTNTSPPGSATYIGGSVTTVAPSYTNATMNALSLDTSGNLRVTGSFSSSASDTTATGTLGALNATVQVALAGQRGAAMQLVAGTLIGTIVPELSVDGGTTWLSTYFVDPTTSAIVSSIVFGSSNTATAESIIVTGGVSHVRIRVSVYTSGSATCNLRASTAEDLALPWIGPYNATAPVAAALVGGKDASGKMQVPQVDTILGQTVEQMSVASTITSPGGAARGIFAFTNAYGSLRTSPESTTVFTDIFDGTIIDPVKWTTTGNVSQSAGLMTINAGTVASQSAVLQGNVTNVNLGLEFEIWGCTAQFSGPATGTYRFIGVGTQSGGAVTDGIGFEYDSTGTLYAVIYASGTNLYRSSALTSPGTSFNRYGFHFRSDLTLFYTVTSEYPVASSSFITPNIQTLAPLFFVKNGGATLGSNAIINLQGVGTTDTGRNASQISDGKYPHRRGEIDQNGRLYIRPGFDTLLSWDAIEGSTLNSWLWKTTATGMTASVSSGSIILTGSTTSGNNINIQTNVQYPFSVGGSVKGTWRIALLNFTNTFIDFGFGSPSGTSNLGGDSAYFKIDVNGNLDGYFYSGGSQVSTGNITGVITSGNYFEYSIEISDRQARFKIESATQKLFDMVLASVNNQPRSFTVSHLPAFVRQANTGTPALGTTVDIGAFEVHLLDINTTKKWEYQMASAGRSATISPTTFAQTAQLAAGAAPTNGAPSNTTSLYTTLGGEYICNATASSENLLSIFGFTIPSPYTFYLTGLFIPPPIVNNAAVATTGTILEFFCIVNCASTNISTGGGQRFTVPGFFSVAVSAAVGTVFNGVAGAWTPVTPVACQPGTVLHIGYKVVLGTATANNRQRGSVYVDGFFE